ncbi:MAG: leucine-rich repeat domain-containing protein [Muribaculaceae bacterium]|nr:leucine-rich repeat domain-containing protein [Muribaculaceae bacterium]
MAAAGTLCARTVVIDGDIDAAGLHQIALSSADEPIELLDLTKARITAWQGRPLASNHTRHPAATLPAYSLSGLHATRVVLPTSITAIGDGALMGSDIEIVEVPATVTDMGKWVFAGCRRLQYATVYASSLPAHTFEGCTQLQHVVLSETLTSIGDDAFRECSTLEYLDLPASVASIGSRAFAHSGLRNMHMRHCTRLTALGDEAFEGCTQLTTVILPDQLRQMGIGVFMGASALRVVNLPSQLTEIPMLTLRGAKALDCDGLIPPATATIGDFALSGLSTPTTLTLPASLKHIGTEALSGWTSLKQIDASELTEVPTLGSDVWAGIDQSKVSLTVWQRIASLYMAAPQWCEFNIVESGIDNISDPTHGGKPQLKVRFEGSDLLVEADSEILRATVVDLNGITIATGAGAQSLRLDTSAATSPFIILSADIAGSGTATVKLIRP